MFLKSISIQNENKLALPSSLTDVYRKFQEQDAKKKSEEDLCNNLKLFGKCKEKRICGFRHYIVPKADFDESVIAREGVQQNDLPENNDEYASIMEYDVATVLSASHFYVRLKRSKNDSGKLVRDFSKSYIRLGMKLSCQDENELEIISRNDLLELPRKELMLVQDKDDFKRAKILSKVCLLNLNMKMGKNRAFNSTEYYD